MCRSSTDECDLPEFCNGSSSFCQSDVFVQVSVCRSASVVVLETGLEMKTSAIKGVVLVLVSDWADFCFFNQTSQDWTFNTVITL